MDKKKKEDISKKAKEGTEKIMTGMKSKLPSLWKMTKKLCKYACVFVFALAVLYCLKTEPWSEGYMEGMTYQDEAFCDALMNDESFTIQDFYVVRNYYNNGETKAQFCSKLIGIFDSQYKEFLEEENKNSENNQDQPKVEENKEENK